MLDKPTAAKNLRLGLVLFLFVLLLFAGTMLIGEIVVHA
jgi:hypothetical protein